MWPSTGQHAVRHVSQHLTCALHHSCESCFTADYVLWVSFWSITWSHEHVVHMPEPLVAYEGILYWNLLKQHISTLEVAMGSTWHEHHDTMLSVNTHSKKHLFQQTSFEVIRTYFYSQVWLQGAHPKTLLMQQMARAFVIVEPTLSRATPPRMVPITPVTTVMAPNLRSAPLGVMLNTWAPALGPQ